MQGVQEFLEKPIGGGIFAQITYKLVIEIVIALIVGAVVGVMFPVPEEQPISGGNITNSTNFTNNTTMMTMSGNFYELKYEGCSMNCRLRSPNCPFVCPLHNNSYFS